MKFAQNLGVGLYSKVALYLRHYGNCCIEWRWSEMLIMCHSLHTFYKLLTGRGKATCEQKKNEGASPILWQNNKPLGI